MDNPLPPLLPPAVSAPRRDDDDKVLIILCHLSAFLGVGLLLPLIVYLVKKQENGRAAAHAKEVLNFHLSLLIYSVGAFALMFVGVGFLIIAAIAVASFVLAIVAAVKASEGVLYRYPLTVRFIS